MGQDVTENAFCWIFLIIRYQPYKSMYGNALCSGGTSIEAEKAVLHLKLTRFTSCFTILALNAAFCWYIRHIWLFCMIFLLLCIPPLRHLLHNCIIHPALCASPKTCLQDRHWRFGIFTCFHKGWFSIFYFIHLWKVVSERIASDVSCPTPGASRPKVLAQEAPGS